MARPSDLARHDRLVDLDAGEATDEWEWYCGCCGNRCGVGRSWCVRCTAPVGHLGPSHLHAWDRTYEAVHGESCPFQITGGTQ